MVADTDISAIVAMADLAASKGDYDRSVQLLRGALGQVERTGDLKQRLDILMKLAAVNQVTGRWVDALMYLDNAFRTASENQMRNVMAEALLASGSILSKKGNWDMALRKYDQAISIIGAESKGPLMARAIIGKGIISWRRGAGQEAIQLARKALSLEGSINDDDIMGSALALVSCTAFDMGDYELSLESNEKALVHFERSGNQGEVIRVLNNNGETYKAMGDYPKALEYFNKGLATSGAMSPRNAGYLLANIAECHARQGRVRDASNYARMAEEKASGLQDTYLLAMLDFVWALIHESEKEPAKAEPRYRSALEKMQSLGIPFDTGMIQTAHGKFLSEQGRPEEAASALEEAVNSFRRSGSEPMLQRAEKLLAKLRT